VLVEGGATEVAVGMTDELKQNNTPNGMSSAAFWLPALWLLSHEIFLGTRFNEGIRHAASGVTGSSSLFFGGPRGSGCPEAAAIEAETCGF